MNVMDMFRTVMGNPAQPQVPQVPGAPVNPATQQPNVPLTQQQAPANASADPANPTFGQPDPKEPKSPLVDFNEFWTNDPKKDGPEPTSLGDFSFNVDKAKIAAASKGMDFTKVITPEVFEAIKAGGDGAMAAMLSAMNTMSQEVMKNAILVSAGIVEGGIKSSGANTEKLLPGLVRKQTISSALREDNPLFSDPATAPMLSMLEGQLTRKFPNATPAEITEHARKYLVNFAKVASGLDPEVAANAQKAADAKKVPSLQDFSTWEA